jgi:hypothetical protein
MRELQPTGAAAAGDDPMVVMRLAGSQPMWTGEVGATKVQQVHA